MRSRGDEAQHWRWGVAAALALAFVSLVPQLELWRARGREWHGSDFSFFFDEPAYAAYVNALINGRPRLNDPYTGRDDETSAPQPESLFSIQFVPAYVLALPARLFGLSAATVFIILCPLVAFASTLALARLVAAVTGDGRTAATVALVVLCFCTFIQKTVRTLLGLQTDYYPLPFLRRYLPALPFALFFVFCLFVWRALTVNDDNDKCPSLMNAVSAGLTFAVLVYSYFYLWTAAAAWLACLALLWLASAQREERGRAARALLTIVAIAAVSLAPYAWLLSRRAASMETVQAFVYTRDPNLLRTSELLGALACLGIIFGAWRGWLAWRDRAVLFAASFALMPFVVFNQQIITGRSLQPIHYEQFIANYISLLALMLVGVLCWQGRAAAGRERDGRGGGGGRIAPKVLASVAVVMLGWALVEVTLATRRARDLNLWRDEVRPVSLRLAEMAKGGEATSGGGERSLVFFPDIAQGDRLPSIAPQAVLWAQHLFVFSGATLSEERERLYLQLYYSNVDEQKFATFIDRPHAYRPSILGWSRIVNGFDATRIPAEDLAVERRAYAFFLSSFNRERAARLPLSYVVVTAGQNELGNLDLWYTRDAGERIGYHVIYRVKLRP